MSDAPHQPINRTEDTSRLLLCLATYEQILAEMLRRQPVAMVLGVAIPSANPEKRAQGRLDSYIGSGGDINAMDALCLQLNDHIDAGLRGGRG